MNLKIEKNEMKWGEMKRVYLRIEGLYGVPVLKNVDEELTETSNIPVKVSCYNPSYFYFNNTGAYQ